MVKEKGMVTTRACNIIQDLTKLCIESQNINGIVQTVFQHVGISMSHKINSLTASHVCIEGGVIANMQIVSAL